MKYSHSHSLNLKLDGQRKKVTCSCLSLDCARHSLFQAQKLKPRTFVLQGQSCCLINLHYSNTNRSTIAILSLTKMCYFKQVTTKISELYELVLQMRAIVRRIYQLRTHGTYSIRQMQNSSAQPDFRDYLNGMLHPGECERVTFRANKDLVDITGSCGSRVMQSHIETNLESAMQLATTNLGCSTSQTFRQRVHVTIDRQLGHGHLYPNPAIWSYANLLIVIIYNTLYATKAWHVAISNVSSVDFSRQLMPETLQCSLLELSKV